MASSLFAHIALITLDTLEPVDGIDHEGTFYSSLAGNKAVFLKDTPWTAGITGQQSRRWVFTCPDLFVRREGWFRLLFTVFELVDGQAEYRTQIHTQPF